MSWSTEPPYHWGLAVTDLDRAAAAWSATPGCGAFAVMDFALDVTYRGRATNVSGRIGYAPLGGPDAPRGYVELVETTAGEWTASAWLASRGESPYHVGYWVDDLAAVLDDPGAPIDSVATDGDGPMFAYLDTVAELGVHTELVRASLRPFLTGWIASAQPA